MSERQNIEYKESWRDEFLKVVCSFANAQDGTLSIGTYNNGEIKGLDNYSRLMEDIPTKIKNLLGILVDTNLEEKEGKHYIEISVQPSAVPISYKGTYYYRSGSTTQELAGAQLSDFLLKKSGRSWDDLIEERATLKDIDEEALKRYISEAESTNRLPKEKGNDTFQLLEKLRLTEGKKLKRAAVILFGKNPRNFYPHAYTKIAKVGSSEDDLQYQEIIEDNLVRTIERIFDILDSKFLVKQIKIEGIKREEKGKYPLVAIREMILNALVHRTYLHAPIQIKVYEDKISIWNEGNLPDGLTVEALKKEHPSIPRNPIIADVCFKGGFIEAWGSGISRIIKSCTGIGLPLPQMEEIANGFSITIFSMYNSEYLEGLGLNERQVNAVLYLQEYGKITNSIYQELYKVSKNTATKDLTALVEKNILERSEKGGPSTYYTLNAN